MLWRLYLVNRIIGSQHIKAIVGRHRIVYVRVLVQFLAIAFLVFLGWRVVYSLFPNYLIQIVGSILIVLSYIRAIYQLLRSYFDVMVATEGYLYIVLRDSFFKYTIKIITRQSIQDISVKPDVGLSALLSDSHVIIATEQDDLIHFRHVYKATDVVQKLYSIRDENVYDLPGDEEDAQAEETVVVDDDKFKVLVETLGEVIVDYMKKKE